MPHKKDPQTWVILMVGGGLHKSNRKRTRIFRFNATG